MIKNIKKGWMPPHPTVFVKKRYLKKVGNYNTDYTISSDYDFLIRVLTNKEIKTLHKQNLDENENWWKKQ